MSVHEFRCTGENDQDLLSLDGPLIDVEITAPLKLVEFLRDNSFPPFPVAKGSAQVDTGAQVSAVDSAIFVDLGVPAVDAELIQTAHGLSGLDRYNASVTFPQLGSAPRPLDLVLGGRFGRPGSAGNDIVLLIGRDLLREWRFTYDGPRSRFSIET